MRRALIAFLFTLVTAASANTQTQSVPYTETNTGTAVCTPTVTTCVPPAATCSETTYNCALNERTAAILLGPLSSGSSQPSGNVIQDPGPSQTLFSNPYYSCTTNLYVATTGNDSTGTGTSGNPWLTLNKAEGSGGPGVCINVAPGTYAAGALITHGGNLASSTGYEVYRCQTMDACTITDPGNQACGANHSAFAVCANYVIIDGFSMINTAQQTFAEGVGVSHNNGTSFAFSQHHVWVLNSIISGFGEAGVTFNEGEFLYTVHNTIYQTAEAGFCDSSAQGSGISYVVPTAISGYSLTADDQNNPITGNTGTLFRQFIMWNVVYNNSVAPCAEIVQLTASISSSQTSITVTSGANYNNSTTVRIDNEYLLITGGGGTTTWTVSRAQDGTTGASHSNNANVYYVGSTDGNGIIADTWNWSCGTGGASSGSCTSGATPYVNGGLIAFNVVYNNGGGGVHLTSSEYVTAANNSCYNNNLDPNNVGVGRPCIDTLNSWGNTLINNIAIAIGGQLPIPNSTTAVGPDGPPTTQTTTLSGGSINSSVTSITLASAANMPGGTAGYGRNSSYALPGGNMIQIDSEVMLVTAGWTTTMLTVTRGYLGTTAASHTNGATITWVPDYWSNNITLGLSGANDVNGPYSGSVYSSTQNKEATSPSWTNVGNSSTGTISTQPVGTNFALGGSSPAIGYGQTSTNGQTFLSSQSTDAGACYHSLVTCP